MSSSTRSVALAALAVAAGLGLVVFLTQAPEPDEVAGSSPEVQAPAPDSPEPAEALHETGPQPRTLELDPSAVDDFVGAIPVQPVTGGTRPPPGERVSPAELLEEARRGGDPVAYRTALEAALKADPGLAPEVARLLLAERDETLAFQTARALSRHMDPATTRTVLDGLPGAEGPARPMSVFALRGAPPGEPEVDRTLVDLYGQDADEGVRQQAAFVLGERARTLEPALHAQALERAREDLRGADSPALLDAAADVLGGAPLDPRDQDWLTSTLRSDPNEARRLAALRALATSGTPREELLPTLQAVQSDPSASQELRDMAGAVLAGQPQ
jgi:hypothetical protein